MSVGKSKAVSERAMRGELLNARVGEGVSVAFSSGRAGKAEIESVRGLSR